MRKTLPVGVSARMDGAQGLAERLDEASLVLAPGLFRTEVANALSKYVHADQLSSEAALERLGEALALVDTEVPDGALVTEALASACRLSHPG